MVREMAFMTSLSTGEGERFLSTLPAGRRERRLALAVVLGIRRAFPRGRPVREDGARAGVGVHVRELLGQLDEVLA